MSLNDDNTTPSSNPTTPIPAGKRSDPATAELLKEFRKRVKTDVMERGTKQALIDQARVFLEGVYVHLPLKKAMYAANPVERLAVLGRRLDDPAFSTLEFHEELIDIFTSLRDLHTAYGLPAPYLGQAAFLPFLVEEFHEDAAPTLANPRYVISHVSPLAINPGLERGADGEPRFRPGVEVVSWNGADISVAVRRNAEREAGGNPEARRARGVDALTIRPLEWTPMPDEDSVVVGYSDGTSLREARFEWRVFEPSLSPTRIGPGDLDRVSRRKQGGSSDDFVDLSQLVLAAGKALQEFLASDRSFASVLSSRAASAPQAGGEEQGGGTGGIGRSNRAGFSILEMSLPEDDEDQGGEGGHPRPPSQHHGDGIDTKAEVARRVKKLLFAQTEDIKQEQAFETSGGKLPIGFKPTEQSALPDVFSFRRVELPQNNGSSLSVGYVRIWTFDVDDPRVFLQEFLRILSVLPQDGLIIDVRGNPGGTITAGEAILQVLTPRRIEPVLFSFICSPLTAKPSEQLNDLEPWRESLKRAATTGDLYSQGFPLASPDWYNLVGQRYHGPVALIVDALCYSTTDIFAAGFQDHGIGVIIGTSTRTGAGGANVWELDDIRDAFGADASKFPKLPDDATFRVAVRRCTRVGPRAGDPIEDLGVTINADSTETKDKLRDTFVYPMKLTDHVPKSPVEPNPGLIKFAAEKLKGRRPYILRLEQPDPNTAQLATQPLPIKLTVRTKNLTRLDILVDGRQWRTRNIESKGHSEDYDLPDEAFGKSVPDGLPQGWVELRGFDEGSILAAAFKFRIGPSRKLPS
jgi:Peptidase family S41